MPRQKKRKKRKKKETGGGADRSSQYQVVSKQRERDLREAGPIFFSKMIASLFFFPFFSDSLRYVSNPCLLFLQKVCSANAFQKTLFQSTMEYRHRSLAVPLVAQSLRALLHCAAAVKTFPLKSPSGLCLFPLFFIVFIAEAGVKRLLGEKRKAYMSYCCFITVKIIITVGYLRPSSNAESS